MNLWKIITGLLTSLTNCEAAVDRIQTKLETIMAKLQDFKDLLAAVDAETTRIALKIDELVGKLNAGGMTEAEEAEVLAQLSAHAAQLKAIGHDPNDPVPVP